MILAGDIGGTKTNLALFRTEGPALAREEIRSFRGSDYPSLEAMIREFLGSGGDADLACFGVAGPVLSGESRMTNLPWTVREESLRAACGARRCFLVNDLFATAFAVPRLSPGDFAVLQEGRAEPGGCMAVVAAGTGLGVAFLVPSGKGYLPFASEGGHVGFSPRDAREVALRAWFGERYGRVSVERLVSGPGLYGIYRFLREREGFPESSRVDARLSAEDPPVVISEEGLRGGSAASREALRVFASLYGAATGDLALAFLATGGVVLGGGIAPAILPVLSEGPFLEAFRAKGRFGGLLSSVPVRVVLDDKAALLGAAHYARETAGP